MTILWCSCVRVVGISEDGDVTCIFEALVVWHAGKGVSFNYKIEVRYQGLRFQHHDAVHPLFFRFCQGFLTGIFSCSEPPLSFATQGWSPALEPLPLPYAAY